MSKFRPRSLRSEERPKKPEVIGDNVQMDLAINSDFINDEMMDQPLLHRKYSDLSANQNKAVKAIELKLDRVEAKWHLLYSKEGGKVKEVESKVRLNEEVQKVEEELLQAQETADSLKGIVVAFRQRHELLREISTNIRKDLED